MRKKVLSLSIQAMFRGYDKQWNFGSDVLPEDHEFADFDAMLWHMLRIVTAHVAARHRDTATPLAVAPAGPPARKRSPGNT